MPVSVLDHTSDSTTFWNWPLTAGILPGDDHLADHILQEPYARRFVQLNSVTDIKQHTNLFLYIDNGPWTIRQLLEGCCRADALIIFCEKDPDQLFASWQQEGYIEQLLARSGCSGIFFCSVQRDIRYWFDDVIVALSHNIPLAQALGDNSDNGFFYYDRRLDRDAKLDAVVNKIAWKLQNGMYGNQLDMYFDLRILDKNTYGAEEMAQELFSKLSSFRYDHETGEATDIANLNAMLGEQFRFPPGWKKKVVEVMDHDPAKAVNDDELMKLVEMEVKELLTNYNMEGDIMPEPVGDLPPESMPTESMPPDNSKRFLLTQVTLPGETAKAVCPLKKQQQYILHARIGFPHNDWIKPEDGISTDGMFTVFDKETIDLVLISADGTIREHRQVILPSSGESGTADFPFTTKEEELIFFLECYHHNRLLQKLKITIPVENGSPDIQVSIVFALRSDPQPLADGILHDAAYTIREDKEGKKSAGAMAGGEAVGLSYTDGVERTMKAIRLLIQNAMLNINDHPEDLLHEKNKDLFNKLALRGNELFTHFVRKRKLDGPLQVIVNRPGFVPLDFVYELAPPAPGAGLCSGAVKALETGICGDCFNKEKSPAPHICPLGFWGFKQVIERSAIEQDGDGPDFLVKAEPGIDGRRTLEILKNVLYATSARIDKVEASTSNDVRTAIETYCENNERVDNWDKWAEAIEAKDRDSLLLLVHVENDIDADSEKVEIGDEQFLLQNYFDRSRLYAERDTVPPMVIIIGCETGNLANHGFDISDKIMVEGAAIVVSNFTKITGRKAGKMFCKLIEFIDSKNGSEFALGEIILQLRRHLLAQGIISGLSLIAYGDADWKLKNT